MSTDEINLLVDVVNVVLVLVGLGVLFALIVAAWSMRNRRKTYEDYLAAQERVQEDADIRAPWRKK